MQEDIMDKVIELGEKHDLINNECLVLDNVEDKIKQLPIDIKNQILTEIYSQFVY